MNKKKRDSSQASTNSCILCGSSSSALVRYVSVGGVEKEYIQKHFGEIPLTNHSCAENMYLRLVGTTITLILYQNGSHSETVAYKNA